MQWLDATLAHGAVLLPQDRVALYVAALEALAEVGVVVIEQQGAGSVGLNPDRLRLYADPLRLQTAGGTRTLTVPADAAARLIDMPCLDAPQERYTAIVKPPHAPGQFLRLSALRRVITAEHTGLLERVPREQLERRFKAKVPQPWFENLLSATPTLEMGVDIGDLSSVMLCSVPPTVASFLQRVGRAGRRDGNACATTLADGASPHDLYFYEEPAEMLAGDVAPPGIFLQAPEVLRRQFCAFCLDDWVAATSAVNTYPDKTARPWTRSIPSMRSGFPTPSSLTRSKTCRDSSRPLSICWATTRIRRWSPGCKPLPRARRRFDRCACACGPPWTNWLRSARSTWRASRSCARASNP